MSENKEIRKLQEKKDGLKSIIDYLMDYAYYANIDYSNVPSEIEVSIEKIRDFSKNCLIDLKKKIKEMKEKNV